MYPYIVSSYNTELYFYNTLLTLRNKQVSVSTTKEEVRGSIQDVQPDHITVVDLNNTPHYVRIEQIIWVNPRLLPR